MNSYDLSRNFCNWAFENPEKVKPIHYAIYFFSIEHCNRLGWKDKFGLPSQMVMEAIGVKNWRTYSAGLNDLVEFGFIEMIETSKNQYSSNIIAIVNFTKAPTKALDKALSKHVQKHSTKHSQSTVSIDKQETKNKEQETTPKGILLNEWIEYRKQLKKKLSEATINKLKEEMSNYSEEKCRFVINASISNGWQGLFWDKFIEKSEATKQPLSEEQIRYNHVMEQMKLNSNQ